MKTGGKQSLFHAKDQALLSYDSKAFQEKTKLGASVVIIPTRREGLTFYFFWINWTQFLNMNPLIDEASSLRLAENREEGTRLNHSRFLASISTCIHESFANNHFDISYIYILEKYMSFINSAHVLVLSKSVLKAFKDHDHAYINFEPSGA